MEQSVKVEKYRAEWNNSMKLTIMEQVANITFVKKNQVITSYINGERAFMGCIDGGDEEELKQELTQMCLENYGAVS